MVRHWTPKPVVISCTRSRTTGGNFFVVVVDSFKYNNAISTNFVQTAKNSKVSRFKVDEIVKFDEKLPVHTQ